LGIDTENALALSAKRSSVSCGSDSRQGGAEETDDGQRDCRARRRREPCGQQHVPGERRGKGDEAAVSALANGECKKLPTLFPRDRQRT
jgi:hypothetical protein